MLFLVRGRVAVRLPAINHWYARPSCRRLRGVFVDGQGRGVLGPVAERHAATATVHWRRRDEASTEASVWRKRRKNDESLMASVLKRQTTVGRRYPKVKGVGGAHCGTRVGLASSVTGQEAFVGPGGQSLESHRCRTSSAGREGRTRNPSFQLSRKWQSIFRLYGLTRASVILHCPSFPSDTQPHQNGRITDGW
jgi:hypothetical protein